MFVDTLAKLDMRNSVSAISTPLNWFQFNFLFSAGFSSGAGSTSATPEGKAKLRDGLFALMAEAANHGWGEYRAPPAFQDEVAKHYAFNDHALRRFNEAIKDAVDPNGILSPGRGGIWPKSFRGRRA